jgi:membrane fusion protein, multidrug efflux system
MQTIKPIRLLQRLTQVSLIGLAAIIVYSCNSSEGSAGNFQQPPPALPVVAVTTIPATTYQEFSASLEGSKDIEIRPQVDGYLEKIFVDEGAQVKKGQILFQVNDRPYREQLNNAKAALAAAKANLVNAEINVSKLTPLVEANVVSEVQLKTAKAAYDAANASVTQAQAMVGNAEINVGYTLIKAPSDGYIGRIPFKTGSLVGVTTPTALTVLSAIREMYAYFSFSEKDFLAFTSEYEGKTVAEKIKQLPPVDLVLADNSLYPAKGKIQIVSGQFDNSIGAISFRASFENEGGLLRSGNTGKIRIPHLLDSALAVPQEATFEIQDKVFVFAVADSNKVISKPITISGKTNNYYFIKSGLEKGEKIVLSGTGNLHDGVVITPQLIAADSLLKTKSL